MGETANYVDIYNLPVAAEKLEQYRETANRFGAVVVELGGLRYREFAADGSGEGAEGADGTVATVAVAEFESKLHRDQVMDAVMADARIKEMTDAEPLADMSRMTYGGFTVLVDA